MNLMETTLDPGLGDDKMNHKHQAALANNKKDTGGETKDLNSINHDAPPGKGQTPSGFMDGQLMNFTQMLEYMNLIKESLEDEAPMEPQTLEETPLDNEPVAPSVGISAGINEDELLSELNQIFTPILVMQNFEGDVADRIQEAFSEASVLMERNIISFDDSTRMAQLVSVCALLIERQLATPDFDVYQKAEEIARATKLKIQKKNYAMAQTLAQKFLVKVSTTNNSSAARSSAQNLLPQTQH